MGVILKVDYRSQPNLLTTFSFYIFKWTSHSKRSTRRSRSSPNSTTSSRRVLRSLGQSSRPSPWITTSCSRLGRRGRRAGFSTLTASCLRRLRTCRSGRGRFRLGWNSSTPSWRCRPKTVLLSSCRVLQRAPGAQFRRGKRGTTAERLAPIRGGLHEQLAHQELFPRQPAFQDRMDQRFIL